jgi:hypothetical protein
MEVAVLAYDGVFDSGLAAILDVLDGANAMGWSSLTRRSGT